MLCLIPIPNVKYRRLCFLLQYNRLQIALMKTKCKVTILLLSSHQKTLCLVIKCLAAGLIITLKIFKQQVNNTLLDIYHLNLLQCFCVFVFEIVN